MINFLNRKKNRSDRRKTKHTATLEERIGSLKCSVLRYPDVAECPRCGYRFTEFLLLRCLVLSYSSAPEIKCWQCNEIMELNALKKIEGVPDDITK